MTHAKTQSPVQVGEVLAGKYRVSRVLGVGGMGAVVEAEDLTMRQRVAIKIMLPDIAREPANVHRFFREARLASTLRSEHIAKVFDAGTLANDLPFLVMELLEGTDLAAVLRERGHLTPAEAAGSMIQLCEALAEAHARGLVHRDIKPANLFMTRQRDGTPLVKVLDFGIARGVHGFTKAITVAPLTGKNEVLGSPLYMSPEQMRGARDIDMRSDIWSIGAVLYKLLTGSVPFRADTLGELCMHIIEGKPRPPHELRAEVAPELSAVVLRCLLSEPAQRYADVVQLAEALAPFAPARDAALVEGARAVFVGFTTPPNELPTVTAISPGSSKPPVATSPSGDAASAPSAPALPATSSATVPNSASPPAETVEEQVPALLTIQPDTRSITPPPLLGAPHRKGAPLLLVAGLLAGALGAVAAFLLLVRGGSNAMDEMQDAPLRKVESTAAIRGPTGTSTSGVAPPPGSSTAVTAPPSATVSPTGRPFDPAAAKAAVMKSGSLAKVNCKGKAGPRVVSATVFFNPSGGAQRIQIKLPDATTPAGLCVQTYLASARVPPFHSNKIESVGTTVSIQ